MEYPEAERKKTYHYKAALIKYLTAYLNDKEAAAEASAIAAVADDNALVSATPNAHTAVAGGVRPADAVAPNMVPVTPNARTGAVGHGQNATPSVAELSALIAHSHIACTELIGKSTAATNKAVEKAVENNNKALEKTNKAVEKTNKAIENVAGKLENFTEKVDILAGKSVEYEDRLDHLEDSKRQLFGHWKESDRKLRRCSSRVDGLERNQRQMEDRFAGEFENFRQHMNLLVDWNQLVDFPSDDEDTIH